MGKKLKVRVTRKLIVTPNLSKEQSMLRSLFGHGERCIMPDENSDSLPEINGALMPRTMGDDSESETAEIFGFLRRE